MSYLATTLPELTSIAVTLPVIVLVLRIIRKEIDKRKPDAQYSHQDATRELDAWESGDTFETRGGIDEQKAWGKDSLEGEEPNITPLSVDEIPMEKEPSESEYVAEKMSIPIQEEVTEETTTNQIEEPPAEAPPLPSGGLPEGWTMEQWRWYGHQWLERHGEQ